jgi:uncharacterized protein YbgA (DUF1722 family)/uncharacterized protein YbbK (DUF523 family)
MSDSRPHPAALSTGATADPAGRRPILVGVSTCLLGEKVRWDAGHKHDRYLTGILGEYFEFVPVCPELEVGMGVPREPVHLTGDPAAPRMIGNRSGDDWTERMNRYSRRKLKELVPMGLSGYILKRASPSCGMERVPVKGKGGMKRKVGVGLFAAELMRRLPLLPVEEEGRLNDPGLRENFIVRVFAYHRVQTLLEGRFKRGEVVAFHAREKFLLLAHSPKHYKELGQLVAQIKDYTPSEFRERYTRLYMEALQVKASVRKNVNVLQHLLGFLREGLGDRERADILRVIDSYRDGLVPLIVPLTLLNHHVQVQQQEYLLEQVYLHPAPAELALRNHV